MSDTVHIIIGLIRRVQADWEERHVISTGEQIAVALILNKPEWLPFPFQHPLDAVDRLGPEWLRACIEIHARQLYLDEPPRI